VQEAGLTEGRCGRLRKLTHPSPGVRTPKRQARSESLYGPTTTSKYNAYVYVFGEILLLSLGNKWGYWRAVKDFSSYGKLTSGCRSERIREQFGIHYGWTVLIRSFRLWFQVNLTWYSNKLDRQSIIYLFIWRGVEHRVGVQYASQSRVESTDKQIEGRHDHGETHVDVIDDDRRRVVLVKMQTTVTQQVEGQAQDAHQDLSGRRHTNRCWVSVRSNYRSSTKWQAGSAPCRQNSNFVVVLGQYGLFLLIQRRSSYSHSGVLLSPDPLDRCRSAKCGNRSFSKRLFQPCWLCLLISGLANMRPSVTCLLSVLQFNKHLIIPVE